MQGSTHVSRKWVWWLEREKVMGKIMGELGIGGRCIDMGMVHGWHEEWRCGVRNKLMRWVEWFMKALMAVHGHGWVKNFMILSQAS